MLDDVLCSFDVTLINLFYMSVISFVVINLFNKFAICLFRDVSGTSQKHFSQVFVIFQKYPAKMWFPKGYYNIW